MDNRQVGGSSPGNMTADLAFPAMDQPISSHPRRGGTGSIASVAGHPLHPMIVPVTIGMYVAATCSDVAFARTGNPFWALGTSWLLLGTLASGCIAAIPGIVDFTLIDRAQKLHIGWAHAGGNLLFLAITVVNYGWRKADPTVPLGHSGLILTFIGLVLLGITGWLGGEMSYRHGIGVATDLGEPD